MLLRHLRRSCIGLVIVEQNLALAAAVSDRATVLSSGRCEREGPSPEILDPARVAASYLGH